jgi:hypothetical protein
VSRASRITALDERLAAYEAEHGALPGIGNARRRAALLFQLDDSAKRTRYVEVVKSRDVSPKRADPTETIFDPILAAISALRDGDVEQASWLVFLSIHFGKNRSSGWELARAVYGRLGKGPVATWESVRKNPSKFCDWIETNAESISKGPPKRSFGNHRKYESLSRTGSRGTPATIESYVTWIKKHKSHAAMFEAAVNAAEGDTAKAFDILYKHMDVKSFARLGKFDYLSMIGKVGIAPIVAGTLYLSGATGPMTGARMLMGSNKNYKELDSALSVMGNAIGVTMQDMEDAICNWQKSPAAYKGFRG